jgi:hypothetical protein
MSFIAKRETFTALPPDYGASRVSLCVKRSKRDARFAAV